MDEHAPAPTTGAELPKRQLSELDADFIRVLDDLIEVLLTNGTLRLTDLPAQAQVKFNQRKQVRQRLRDALNPLDDDHDGLI